MTLRILLGSALLAATAGMAQAQAVTIGGEGRFGLLYETIGIGGLSFSDWAQENRLVLNFDVEVRGDHGLTFGAHSRVQIDSGAAGMFSGSHVYVEGAGLRVSLGNLDGAILHTGVSHGFGGGCGIGYVGGHYCGDASGLTGLFYLGLNDPFGIPNATLMPGQGQEFDYTGGGPASRLRVDYGQDSLRLSLSHDRQGATELGARYGFGAVTVALGYSNRATVALPVPEGFVPGLAPGNVLALSGRYDGGTWGLGAVIARVRYAGGLGPLSHTNWSLSGNVGLGGGDLYGYIGRVHHASLFGLVPFDTAGVSYGYGLGGGATLTAGVETMRARLPPFGPSRFTSASLGVAFNF